MVEQPFFSVIIPTYNRAKFIASTIQTVLDQKFSDFELIIIDDGSTDGTQEEMKKFKDERITYFHKKNEERGAARNAGARLAKGRYLNFLDSDDSLYPHHLSRARDFIEKHPDEVIFHLAYDVKDFSGKTLMKMDAMRNINQQIIHGNVLSCNGVFVRKDILLQNPFNEDRSLSTLEDWELWIRMCARFPFLHDNHITSTIVLHDERSVVVGDEAKIKLKGNLFIKYVSEDAENQRVYGELLKKAYSSVLMYVALHLAMAGSRSSGVLKYLRMGVSSNWHTIFTKRFVVILRFLLLRR